MHTHLLALSLCLIATGAAAAGERQPARRPPAAVTSAADAASRPVLEFDPSGPEHWRATGAWTMRANPSRSAKAVGEVSPGEDLTVLGRVSNSNWYALVRDSGVVSFVEVERPPAKLVSTGSTCPVGREP